MRKLQNTLYITREGTYLHKERETLLIEQTVDGKKEKLLQLPIHSVGHIFCFGNVMLSPFVMGFCGENGVGLTFYQANGRYLARLEGRQSGNVLLRRAQYRLADSDPLPIARDVIAAKIKSSLRLLQRHLRNHQESEAVSAVIQRLKQILAALPAQQTIDSLRGFEGEAASHYFSVFEQLITRKGTDFRFNKRERRPPRDPVNAMLSFLYSVLGNEVGSALQGVGLDPQVGFLHQERPGRDSLAQDLLEELRAYIVDRLVLTLINRGEVKPKDFVQQTGGAVLMKDDTRKQLLQAYQAKKMEKISHPFLDETLEIGLIPHVQAQLLARHIRGDLAHYPPFVMR